VNGACTEIHADTDKAAKEQIAKRPGLEPGRRYRLRILKSVLRAADFHVGLASLDDGCAGRGQLPHALRVDKIAIGPVVVTVFTETGWVFPATSEAHHDRTAAPPPKAIRHAYFIRLRIIVCQLLLVSQAISFRRGENRSAAECRKRQVPDCTFATAKQKLHNADS